MMEQQRESKIFTTLFQYTIMFILGPVSMFFGAKMFILDGLFGMSSTASSVWAAVAAIVLLHAILGMYIYRAYSLDSTRTKPDKID